MKLCYVIPALGLIALTCTEQVSPPESMRVLLTVSVIDTSVFTQTLADTTLVDSASVTIHSIAYQHEFQDMTDASGRVYFEQILPDVYNISATKCLPPEVVQQVTGVPSEIVLNGQLQDVSVDADHNELEVHMVPMPIGKIIFSEVYYNGAPPNPPFYFHDQFTELYNNTDSTIYLDSLIISDADYGYMEEDFIHAIHAYMFPGLGRDYPLLPGQFVIIAQDAKNHLDNNPHSLDLSMADFEYYAEGEGDVNNPDVPDMIQLHHKYGIDFLYSVMNDAIVLSRVNDPYEYGYDNYNQLLIPKTAVLDGIEYREDISEIDRKRLDVTIDAGLTGGIPMYSGKSVERKVSERRGDRVILKDNNNSSIDFQVLDDPTPGYIGDAGDQN